LPCVTNRLSQSKQELTSVLRELTCEQAKIVVRGTRFEGNTCGYALSDDRRAGIYGLTMFDFIDPATGEKLGTIMVKLHELD
jgi:hypothetical protein